MLELSLLSDDALLSETNDSYLSATRMWEDLNLHGNESSLNTMGVVQKSKSNFYIILRSMTE
jgi:hypothetical protein